MSIFAPIYQGVEDLFGWYDSDYELIFNYLYDNGGYDYFGLVLVGITLAIVGVFYFLPKFPYAKKWHWGVMLLISSITIFIGTQGIANLQVLAPQNRELMDAFSDSSSGYQDFADTLPFKYSMLNAILSIVLGFLISLVVKPFSKCRMHLPF